MGWKRFSIAGKLYLVVGVMAVLIALELFALRFSMSKLSAVRAFVEGEGLWSKAQKDAAFSLQRYAVTHEESDYQEFLEHLRVPDGDHRARLELEKPNPDMQVVREGFIQGRIHPDDIDSMISLLQNFSWVSYLREAISYWKEGDRLLAELKVAGAEYRAALRAKPMDRKKSAEAFARIRTINLQLTGVEAAFSQSLGAGSRWLERVVFSLLFFAVLMVESIGLTLTVRTTRRITHGLAALNDAADRMGRGDFSPHLDVQSDDEIGQLTESLNRMGALLKVSYTNLEARVRERTSELAQMASENARLYSEAKAALQLRDEFLSVASHELKTPLTALLLQLQLSLRSKNTASASGDKSDIEKAVGHTKRLVALIEQLLDLTRIRAGKLEIQCVKCDLRPLVTDLVSQLSAEATRAGSKMALQAEIPVNGNFDSLRMGQVITNLLTNAIKYGQGRPIHVALDISQGHARIQVRDHGDGIAPDQQAQIFERFERVHSEGSVPGLGLGLYIAKRIVEAHNGKIQVESDVGKGALFTVLVPLA